MRKSFVLLTLILLTTTRLFAQNDSLNAVKIAEVYGPTFQTEWPILYGQLEELLNTRISYVEEPVYPDEKYPLIASLPLMNKHNPALQPHDPALFNVITFNPLIYTWNFFDDNILVYRIDGTDYLLVIQPQSP